MYMITALMLTQVRFTEIILKQNAYSKVSEQGYLYFQIELNLLAL